jgi:ubiquinone/menaquinone biosynthesis C-methylase UbiE
MTINDFNQGMYADGQVASQWNDWVHNSRPDDIRFTQIYPYLSRWMQEHQPGTVLEIGSGQGVSSERITLGMSQYLGIEPSKPLREFAHQQYPHLNFMAGRAEQLPIPDGSVDAAFSVYVWLHIDDTNSAAAELSRVLSPGGHFVIATANPDRYDIWRSWHTNIVMTGRELRGDMPRLSGHTMYLYPLSELTDSLNRHGLVITEMFTCDDAGRHDDSSGVAIIISGSKS